MDAVMSSFVELLGKDGINITDRQLQQFELYYQLLVEWNERMNLTAITDREQVYVKHFFDSLTVSLVHPITGAKRVADIGSGAGFPGIPLKIMFPDISLTIVDSLKKRIGFLQHVADRLGLKEVTLIHARAEDAGRDSAHRDRYDIVTARAVARLSVLNELCLPFVRPGGVFIAMKGAQAREELEESQFSLRQLQGELIEDRVMLLPLEEADRHLLVIRKKADTPKKYPRKAGVPIKQPLVQ
ncbi:16S rRNA (guanine(527)-N(7))-methyltransferase RsmG [Paenibacillus thermoaerophilus]|uniref:Ribosomal RNA small subunit methyltransferase G n=1 Tax=Paenibacillus thermoaerophilus TaxID=1215385 RepID=A0ABW2UZU5_9BACL|nr:16S rRNA (guanine(527)-N(7))-methyltransferase RsmG [Paenibacillus thermoaerophilus]TMV06683.1 16S rRNA (guanine(527)-N(7))-methyltransferase RsmG [Paenibacillus thermoaerophilus]